MQSSSELALGALTMLNSQKEVKCPDKDGNRF
jgi:hypothetical protein